MKHSIIISDDLAGKNIAQFLDEFGVPYVSHDGKCIYAEHLDKDVEGESLIFATTHRSAKGVQSLTVHYPGNFGAAALGGREKQLCVAPASLGKALFLALKAKYDGEVSFEATHHGPYLEKPAVFIESGKTLS